MYISNSISIEKGIRHETRRQIFSRVFDEAGGFEHVKVFGDHPRNRYQISNLRRNADRDETTEILDLSKEQWQNPSTVFVRHISSGTEKAVFLANDRQLKDVERFCTEPQSFSILSVDPTYKIGNFYVTVTTYRHLMLYTSKDVHPLMIFINSSQEGIRFLFFTTIQYGKVQQGTGAHQMFRHKW